MKTSLLARVGGPILLVAAFLLVLPACQPGQARLAQLEATQQQQAREIAGLKQRLADKEAEVTQLETCVDELESAVYEEPDSVAYDEQRPAGPVAL